MKRFNFLLLFILGLVGAILACGPLSGGGDQAATVAALSTSLAATATFTPPPADNPTATNPAANGATATPGAANATLEAALAQATQQAITIQQTRDAQATLDAQNSASMEATLSPIRAELAQYGIDASTGRLGWVHPPLALDAAGYMQYNYDNEFLATLARDFVIAADITWNTQFGTTGCGFVLRSDGNEEAVNQYLVIGTRGGNGRVLWGVQQNGEVNLDDSIDIYANGIDPQFEWENDTTNRIVVVGIGQNFTIYSNGTKLGDIVGTAGFERGFTAFVALNESGTTHCEFTNSWLWLLN